MKIYKLVCIFIVIFSFQLFPSSDIFAVQESFEVFVQAEEFIQLSIPSEQVYTLSQPLKKNTEIVAKNLTIILTSNNYINPENSAFITIQTDNIVPYYDLEFYNGRLSTTYSVSAKEFIKGVIATDAVPLVYADSTQESTVGSIVYSFDINVKKNTIVSKGDYVHNLYIVGSNEGI